MKQIDCTGYTMGHFSEKKSHHRHKLKKMTKGDFKICGIHQHHAVSTLARTDLLYMLNWGTQWTMVSYLEKKIEIKT